MQGSTDETCSPPTAWACECFGLALRLAGVALLLLNVRNAIWSARLAFNLGRDLNLELTTALLMIGIAAYLVRGAPLLMRFAYVSKDVTLKKGE